MKANVTVRDADRARWITIARSSKANALMPDDCRAIQKLVESLPREVEAVVFRGEGDRSFCASMDVVAFLGHRGDAGAARRRRRLHLQPAPGLDEAHGAGVRGGRARQPAHHLLRPQRIRRRRPLRGQVGRGASR